MYDLFKYINTTTVKEAVSPLITETKIVTNPTIDNFVSEDYKPLSTGRTPERDIEEGEGIATTYEEQNAVIVKNEDIFTKEVVQVDKPTEPLDDYYYYKAIVIETDTQIIYTWEKSEKPILDVTELDEQTQYKGENFTDEIEEEQVKRTYEVIDKEVITDPEPLQPDDYCEDWYDKENYTIYEATEIHKGFIYKATEERRIAHLEVTKREFCLALKELHDISYSQLMQLVESTEATKMAWRECVKLLRADSSLDVAGQALGLSHEDINTIFRYIHGEVNNA